jgi:hypothetical protein
MERYHVELAEAVKTLSDDQRSELAKKVLACLSCHVTCTLPHPCGLYSDCEYTVAKRNRMGLTAKTAKDIEQVYGHAVRRLCSVEQTYFDNIGELKPHFAEIVTHIAESIHGVLRVNEDRDDNLITNEDADQVENAFRSCINSWHRCFAEQFWQSGLSLSPYNWSSEPDEAAELAETAEPFVSAVPTELAKPPNP